MQYSEMFQNKNKIDNKHRKLLLMIPLALMQMQKSRNELRTKYVTRAIYSPTFYLCEINSRRISRKDEKRTAMSYNL